MPWLRLLAAGHLSWKTGFDTRLGRVGFSPDNTYNYTNADYSVIVIDSDLK
jgi:hypothetical protein